MAQITIKMFGRFSAASPAGQLTGLTATKVQELLAYLLLHRDHPQSREVLAGLLWGDTESWRAKKYLRQALWQLQAALRSLGKLGQQVLRVDPEWVELRTAPSLWLDAALIDAAAAELAAAPTSGTLDPALRERLRAAVEVYEDNLLPGWYQEWCVYERDRLHSRYLALLDALMADCEVRGAGEEGIRYGALSLHHDRGCERTHQRLMRLYCLAGDRAAALRQYDRCVIALDEELGVVPAAETSALYERIRGGHLEAKPTAVRAAIAQGGADLQDVLAQLKQMGMMLEEQRQQVQVGIRLVEATLGVNLRSGEPVVRQPVARIVASR